MNKRKTGCVIKHYRLGEAEELIKEAFGIKNEKRNNCFSTREIENIRKKLENEVNDILYSDIKNSILS